MKNPAGHLRILAAALAAAALLSDCGGSGGYGGGSASSGVTYPAPVLGDLVITEVMSQPAGSSPATKEWFEVLNTSSNTLQLDGVVVTVNATSTFTVPAGVLMPPAAYFVFASSNNSADNAMLPVVNVNYGTALTLSNTNLTLSLSLGATTLDTVVFTTSTSGKSLSLDPAAQDPTANDDVAANWCLSTTAYGDGTNQGTPGAAGATCP